MNYITEINAFYDWAEVNQPKSAEISLWYALMHMANKCGWKTDFSVPISTLMIKTGLSRSSIENARNKLQQKGRIKFKSRAGNQSAVYRMIPFVPKIQAQTDAQDRGQVSPQFAVQSRPQTEPIHKQRQKQDKTNNNPHISPFEKFGGDNRELAAALYDFEQMRDKIKKPLTERAQEMLVSDLTKLSADPKTQVAILEQSIKHCWQGVFPLKTGSGSAASAPSYDIEAFAQLGYDIPEI